MSLEVTQTVPFKYEKTIEIDRLLKGYKDIVNLCIQELIRLRKTSLKALHDAVYRKLKAKYSYQTSFYVTAYRVAIQTVKAWRKTGGETPRIEKLFAKVSPLAYKFDGETLRISIKPKQFVYLKLKYGSYQRKFIEAWKRGELKIGEIILNERYVIIPFKRVVELTKPEGYIALDLNENCIVGVSDKGEVKRWDCSYIGRTRAKYEAIRAKIQRNVANHTRKFKRLMAKYGAREANKVKDFLHKLAKQIVKDTKKYNLILEDLKGLRSSTNKRKKKFNRFNGKVQSCSVNPKGFKHRWNSFPYRKIQFLLDYKKRLNGLETHYVDRAYTSARCSVCGSEIKPKEHLCPKCGLNRHVNACLNLLKRFGVAFSPTPQPHNDSMSHALTIQPKAGMRTSMARGEREVGRHLNLSNLPTG